MGTMEVGHGRKTSWKAWIGQRSLPIFVEILGTWISFDPKKEHFKNCNQELVLDVQIAVLGHVSVVPLMCIQNDF